MNNSGDQETDVPSRTSIVALAMTLRACALLSALLGFGGVTIALDLPMARSGTFLGHMTRWEPFSPSYEMMIASIYAAWAPMMWRAARNPLAHPLFIEFTILANFAHFFVMLALAFRGEHHHLCSDVPPLGIASSALLVTCVLARRDHHARLRATTQTRY